MLISSLFSWLGHRFVSSGPNGRARALRAAALDDVRPVVVGELAHGRAEDRRARDPESAQREVVEVVGELAEPREVVLAPYPRPDGLEDPRHPLGADAAGDADRARLLRE